MVFKYPDGSYSYAFKSEIESCWMELRPKKQTQRDEESFLTSGVYKPFEEYQIMQIKDEVQFLCNNLDFVVGPDQAIKSYYHHRLVLYMI
jgi:hypothetical protein